MKTNNDFKQEPKRNSSNKISFQQLEIINKHIQENKALKKMEDCRNRNNEKECIPSVNNCMSVYLMM